MQVTQRVRGAGPEQTGESGIEVGRSAGRDASQLGYDRGVKLRQGVHSVRQDPVMSQDWQPYGRQSQYNPAFKTMKQYSHPVTRWAQAATTARVSTIMSRRKSPRSDCA